MAGADKVFINSQAVKNPNFINKLSKKFGSQSVVVNIEVKKFENNRWEVFITNGRDRTEIEVTDWIKKCEDLGAGEIMITSIDKEGTGKGPDLELLNQVQNHTNLPLIYSGGVGNLQHIKNLSRISIDGLALSRVLHYNLLDIQEIKSALNFSI